MAFKPAIKSAIPKKRYRFGEYQVTALHQVESEDSVTYLYIVAVMLENDPEPGLFITAEKDTSNDKQTLIRLKMRDGEQLIDTNEKYKNFDEFMSYALQVISKILNLEDETPYIIN